MDPTAVNDSMQSSLNDFVAAIHALRSQFEEDTLTGDQEIAQLMDQLKKLETYITEFDDLAGVKELKSILLGQMNTSISSSGIADGVRSSSIINSGNNSSSSSSGTSLRVPIHENSTVHVMRKRVFEIVRTEFIPQLKQAIQTSLANDEAECRDVLLLNNAFSHVPVINKKQKGEFYSSFNFDDIPDYEPLETTLKLLRADHCSESVLTKLLLELELDDLTDHPQWKELLTLIRYTLYHGTNHTRILSMQLHIRFATGLTDTQSAGAVLNLLNYFIDKWVVLGGDTNQLLPVELDDFTMVHLSVFSSLLDIIPSRILHPSMEMDGDRLIATVFILLAQGRVAINTTLQSDTIVAPRIPLLDALTGFTRQRGDFISAIMAKRRPAAVMMHAVHSRLIAVLGRRVMVQPTDKDDDAASFTAALRILLNLFLPFATSAGVMDFCAKFVLLSSADVPLDLQGYVWDGAMEPRDDERFKETWRTELLLSVGASSVAMKADQSVNRLISHLAGAKPFVNDFLTNVPSASPTASPGVDFDTRVADGFGRVVVHLSATLKGFVSAVGDSECLSSALELLLRTVARSHSLLSPEMVQQVVDDCVDCVVSCGRHRAPASSPPSSGCKMGGCLAWSSAMLDGLDALLLVAGGSFVHAATRATTAIYAYLDASAADASLRDRRHTVLQKVFVLWTHVMQTAGGVGGGGDVDTSVGVLLQVLWDALARPGAAEATMTVPCKTPESPAVALQIAVMLHGCRDQRCASALEKASGLVTALVSNLTLRLCTLCGVMQRARAIETPLPAVVDHPTDPTLSPREATVEATQPLSTTASSSAGLEALVLVDAILAAVRVWGERAVTVVLSTSTMQSMVNVLRREDTSEHVWESAMAVPLGDEVPLLRLLAGLCQRSSFPTQSSSAVVHRRSADRVLSLCVSAWEPLRDFCTHHSLLSNSLLPTPPAHSGVPEVESNVRVESLAHAPSPQFGNGSGMGLAGTAVHDGITARLLAVVLQTNSMGGVEFEGIGPYVLRLLFCCLSSEHVCVELCESIAAQADVMEVDSSVAEVGDDDHHPYDHDVMGCFVLQLRTHVASLNSSKVSARGCQDFGELLVFMNYNV